MEEEKIKIKIDSDEWYPVYSFTESYGTEIEIEKREYEQMKKICDEFEKVQNVIHKLLKEHWGKNETINKKNFKSRNR